MMPSAAQPNAVCGVHAAGRFRLPRPGRRRPRRLRAQASELALYNPLQFGTAPHLFRRSPQTAGSGRQQRLRRGRSITDQFDESSQSPDWHDAMVEIRVRWSVIADRFDHNWSHGKAAAPMINIIGGKTAAGGSVAWP